MASYFSTVAGPGDGRGTAEAEPVAGLRLRCSSIRLLHQMSTSQPIPPIRIPLRTLGSIPLSHARQQGLVQSIVPDLHLAPSRNGGQCRVRQGSKLDPDLPAPPPGGQGGDQVAELGVVRLDVDRQAVRSEGLGRCRANRADHRVRLEGLTKLLIVAFGRGELEEVLDLLGRGEERRADSPGGDLGDRRAERAKIVGEGPAVDRNPGDDRPAWASPSISSTFGLPYSCNATRRPFTGSWLSRIASVSCQVLGSGTWRSTRA